MSRTLPPASHVGTPLRLRLRLLPTARLSSTAAAAERMDSIAAGVVSDAAAHGTSLLSATTNAGCLLTLGC